MKQADKEEADKLAKFGFEALAYDIKGDHSMVSSWGGMSPPKDLNMVKPIERVLHSGLFGPWDRPGHQGHPARRTAARRSTRPATRPGAPTRSSSSPTSRCCSGRRAGTSPTTTGRPRWTSTSSRRPCTSCRRRTRVERLAQELAAVTFKEYAFQDANTLEATQTMIGTRVVTDFPLCDQEILLRHLHKTAGDYVNEYKKRMQGSHAMRRMPLSKLPD